MAEKINTPQGQDPESLPATRQDAPTFAPAISVGGAFGVDVAVARTVAETQAALLVAQRFPRDIEVARQRILTNCSRLRLAENALYSYKRGTELVGGASIRLAEMLARELGHIAWGFAEVETRRDSTVIKAEAWDRQTNAYSSRTFSVKHERHTKAGSYRLTDPRDIYENNANMAQRRVRSCILALVPSDIVDEATQACKHTVATKGQAGPLIDRVRAMADSFGTLGVTITMLEGHLGHALDATIERELVSLRKIYVGIRDGETRREEFFDLAQAGSDATQQDDKGTRTHKLKRRLRKKDKTAAEGQSPPSTDEKAASAPEPPAEPAPPDNESVKPTTVELRLLVMRLKPHALKLGVDFDKLTFTRLRGPVSACTDEKALAALLDEVTQACDDAQAAAKSN
ncbi:MAG TPA: hypothetical protein VM695_10125 [Phycisphaerae bacterium]|nr:hypothetical protein [Phycisphaerae bacterium]